MRALGDLALIREGATLLAWKRSREPHGPPHGPLSRIGRRRPVEHLPLLPGALLGPGLCCSRGHVAGHVLRGPLLPDDAALLLLLQDQLSDALSL